MKDLRKTNLSQAESSNWFQDVDGLFTNAINNDEILANQLEWF